jgi:hypothetical protein
LTDTPPPPDLATRLSAYAASALRYWEPRRLLFNATLALVVLLHAAARWPEAQARLTLDLGLGVFFLAVLANVCYCTVYVVDLFVQFAGLHTAWAWGRPLLLAIGTAFAAVITHFLSQGMFH